MIYINFLISIFNDKRRTWRNCYLKEIAYEFAIHYLSLKRRSEVVN